MEIFSLHLSQWALGLAGPTPIDIVMVLGSDSIGSIVVHSWFVVFGS
jgi:hypothetical protein